MTREPGIAWGGSSEGKTRDGRQQQSMDILQRLKARMAAHHPRDLPPNPHRRAAVLVPIFVSGGVPCMMLTKRTEDVEHHKGQISFPGGQHEAQDPDLLATALRETREELGLPPERIEVWGRLDEVETVVSGFAITPFVGFLPSPVEARPNPSEIEAIVAAPLGFFMDPTNLRVERVIRDGRELDLLYYDYPPHVIWGVTARIIQGLVRLLAVEAECGHATRAAEPEGGRSQAC
jgi:8-oxo-dGTP pyrophosphatase MutT (NUDIX family)